MQLKKNIKLGKIKIIVNLIFLIFFCINSYAVQKNKNLEGNFVEIKILDKVSSKNSQLILKIGEEKKFDWQKPHLPNQTGTEDSYHPKKMKKDEINKKYKSWKN